MTSLTLSGFERSAFHTPRKRVPARKMLLGQTQEKDQKAISQHNNELSSLLPPKETSRMIGFSYKTLWRWWKEGKIRSKPLPEGVSTYGS